MATDASGLWYPDLWGEQIQAFNCFKRILLLSGPSLSGKTHIALHKICRHLWETDGAQVAMFSKILKNAKDGGTWKILHKRIVKEWAESGIGFQYTTKTNEGKPGPKVDGQTRTPYFRILNAFGTESECMLFSLDHDDDIEDKIKEQEFSMIYFSELDKFRDRKVLSISLPRLRMGHLKYDQQQWLADTNPSDEGESSWIYNVFYRERVQTYEQYVAFNKDRGLPTLKEPEFLSFQQSLELIEFRPDTNPTLDPRQLEELKTTYHYDAGLYARYVEGKWIYGDGDASRHFRGYYKPVNHRIGNCESSNDSDWEYANPSPGCFELISGWDLGETNHAAVIMESMIIDGVSHFIVLDELVSIQQEVSNETFTHAFMEMVANLEKIAGTQLGLDRSWSDRSSTEKYSATGDTFPYKQVYSASGERIFLRGVPKAKGSVKTRVQLLKQLLSQNRIHISAHCKFVIRMFEELKKGMHSLNFVVQDENKHAFDALTYALLMECAEDLDDLPTTGSRDRSPTPIQV